VVADRTCLNQQRAQADFSDLVLNMERGFDLQTGCIAIGDPAMGLATFDLHLLPGRYCCSPGTLKQHSVKDIQTISLDGPFLFVVDAALAEKFLKWFHRTFNECGCVIPNVAMRLDEATVEVGVQVGFYWEETLSCRAQEGSYAFDATKIVMCS